MKAKLHTPEQVIRKLREAEVLLTEGKSVAEVAYVRDHANLPTSDHRNSPDMSSPLGWAARAVEAAWTLGVRPSRELETAGVRGCVSCLT